MCTTTGTRNASSKAMLLFRSLPDDGPFDADCELVWKSKKHQHLRLLLHEDIMFFLSRQLVLQQFGISVQATASESAQKKLHILFFLSGACKSLTKAGSSFSWLLLIFGIPLFVTGTIWSSVFFLSGWLGIDVCGFSLVGHHQSQ